MNANKKNIMNGGWILCPSKTFPGKLYYFNVLTGEAAWSLDDAEKNIIKTIPKVQESHHHPEPSSPPTEPIPKFSLQQPKLIFGQSAFPKVLPKPVTYEKIIWTPTQIEVPIVVPWESRLDDQSRVPKAVKQKIIWDFNNELFVHAIDTPLTKRFVNFEKTIISFDEDNKIQNKLQLDEFYTPKTATKTMAPSIPKGFGFPDSQIQNKPQFDGFYTPKTANKTMASNIPKGFSFPDSQIQDKPQFDAFYTPKTDTKTMASNIPKGFGFPDSTIQNKPQFDAFYMPETATKTMASDIPKGFSFPDFKIQNKPQFDAFYTPKTATKTMASNIPKGFSFSDNKLQKKLIKEAIFNIEVRSETPEDTQIEPEGDEVEVGNMDGNRLDRAFGDLRHLLIAKKRKSQVNFEVESKKRKMPIESTPKKKVSFNLDYEDIESDDDDMNFIEKYTSTIQILRNLSRTVVDQWCLIVDGEILLDEFCFIDRFVQLDPHCKLFIPSPALSYVRAASRGRNATAARSTLRRLDAPYIIVQSDDVTGASPNDDIIKSCMDAKYKNMHVVLISKDIELLANAKCYPIHCYHITTIKNGLSPKPEDKKNMKITIRNTEANLMKNSPDENVFEDFNDTLKYKQNANMINECMTPIDTSNKNSRIENSILDKNSLFECSKKTNLNANWIEPNSTTNFMKLSQKNSQENSKNSINLQNNRQESNINSMSLNHLFNKTKEVFDNITNKDANKPKMLTEWRYAESDNIETTIEADFRNLNLNEKYHIQKDKLNKNVSYITHSTPKIQNFKNRTPMFQICETAQDSFEIQKSNFRTPSEVQKSKFKMALFQNNGANEQDSNFNSPIFPNTWENVQDSNYENQKSNCETLFQRGRNNAQDSFDIQKSKFKIALFQNNGANEKDSNFNSPIFPNTWENVQDSNYDIQKSNCEPLFQRGRNNAQDSFDIQKSKFKSPIFQDGCENVQEPNFQGQKTNFKTIFQNTSESENSKEFPKSKEPQYEKTTEDVFKKPNKPLNWTKRGYNIDLSEFYVKNKVMDSRLKERMDEFVCTYTQIMEEFLTSILEKISPSGLKSIAPPWSLYEAMQCAKTIYKDHVMVKNIIDQLTGFLYESECRKDKMKMVITPSEFMKAIGCGVHLIQYMKKILQHSSEIVDSEENLMDMIKQIEDPVDDVNEPLVKTPVECNTDYKEIRQNFVKNRADIVKYLKKHYTNWSTYEEKDNRMKIVRTFGRNLNMLKLERVKDIQNTDVLKNVDVGTKNTDVMKDVENVRKFLNKPSSESTKVHDNTTKNVGVYVIKDTTNTESDRVKILQEKSNTVQNGDPNLRKDIDKPKTKSIFDFAIPKDRNRNDKFNIKDLGIKITIPNKENSKHIENKEKSSIEKSKCVRKLKYDDKNKEIHQNKTESKKNIRNDHFTDESEKRLKNNKTIEFNNLDSISSTYTDDQIDQTENNIDHTKLNVNKLNSRNEIKNDYEDIIKSYITNHSKIKIKVPRKSSQNNNRNNDPKTHKNDPKSGNDSKTDANDPKNANERKTEKDDNDSGLGNESPRVYSVVKSFSFELESSLENIRSYIDGCLLDYHQGNLNEEKKKMFRLKAFETNFLLTRTISRLNKLVQNEVSNEKIVTKNAEVMLKCLEQGELLQKALNMILTMTNENSLVDLTSSMSLNLSS